MSNDFSVAISDADQVRITFAAVAISRGAGQSGYADGEFLKVTQDKDSFTAVEGTDGSVTRSKTNSRLGTITLRTMQSNAQTNGYLSSLLTADENNTNGAGIGTFVVEDLNGTTKFKALKAWLMKPPDQSFDRSAKEREWKFQVVRTNIVVGGN